VEKDALNATLQAVLSELGVCNAQQAISGGGELLRCVPRDALSIPCLGCGGYSRVVECTQDEVETHQTCGRDYACCIQSFVCILCGRREVVHLEAPDVGW
jgi:hypothetical protein